MRPTADLCDQHGDRFAVAAPIFRAYGARARFAGTVATLECFEDNSLVRTMLEEPGAGRVLVVDGRGSLRCALVGGNLAVLAHRNGWSGIVVHGCVRDSAELRLVDVGILALATNPRRSEKRGAGRATSRSRLRASRSGQVSGCAPTRTAWSSPPRHPEGGRRRQGPKGPSPQEGITTDTPRFAPGRYKATAVSVTGGLRLARRGTGTAFVPSKAVKARTIVRWMEAVSPTATTTRRSTSGSSRRRR